MERKTSKRVIEQMGDNIGFFTDQFSIQDFFDNSGNPKEDLIAAIIITPNQVMIGVAPRYHGGLSHEKGIINPIFKASNYNRDDGFIQLRLASSQGNKFCYYTVEYGETDGATEEMKAVFGLISDRITGMDLQVLTNVGNDLPIKVDKNARTEIGEKIIGVPIDEYLRRMREENLEKASKVNGRARKSKDKYTIKDEERESKEKIIGVEF